MRTLILACLLAVSLPDRGAAAVLTFDDIGTLPIHIGGNHPITITTAQIPFGHGGFAWENMLFINATVSSPAPSGFAAGRVSGDYVAFNGSGNPALVVFGGRFDFEGAYMTAAWRDDLVLDVLGIRQGIVTHHDTLTLSPDAPLWFAANFTGVDGLAFFSTGGTNAGLGADGTQFVMDNFTFDPAPVPEPATLLLVGAGGAGVLARRRARR